MQGLIDYIRQRADLPPEELQWLCDKAQRRVLRRGEAFCTVGQAPHSVGFVESGVLQIYGVSVDGSHNVIDFLFSGGVALAIETALRNMPSRVSIESVKPATVLVWPYALLQELLARHPGWIALRLRMTEEALIHKQAQFLALRVQDARQRYADLDSVMPREWRDLPQHLIASYLDITPQYLSALRRAERSGQGDETRLRTRAYAAAQLA